MNESEIDCVVKKVVW